MLREENQYYPCVGCGYCCIRQTCTFGVQLHPESWDRTCPELFWDGGRYRCRLLMDGDPRGDFYRDLLQAGQGCRSHGNPWRRDVRPREGEKAPEDY
ncbi:MAG TPA: hypothetical protein PK836_06200 [Syntrophales bacterium]|nr:hypothetical protein [Syntrophales bacterium]HOM07256.1 hypothetical protein [Syntrophales bacterium]HON99736.1 hypothetical protein [Syntrophales bacterium]HPC01263.1 hypothetical protein [Syntrophales bacterium]HPQ06919.1 hypothetical protein [Syntrophales bacterium]